MGRRREAIDIEELVLERHICLVYFLLSVCMYVCTMYYGCLSADTVMVTNLANDQVAMHDTWYSGEIVCYKYRITAT